MKRIIKFFLKLLIALALLTAVLFIVSKLFENKIVNKAITILNKQIDVPIYVDSISFSIIKKFPQATLQLHNVTLLSAKDFNQSDFNNSNVDTLAFIGELFLSINLPALIDNSLHITKAYIQNGYVNILVDKKGKENYKIFNKKSKDVTKTKSSTNNFEFLLSKIQLKQFEIRFINKYKNSSVSIYASDYTINGKFYKKKYTANTKGKLLLNYFEQGKIKIHPDLPAKINTNLSISNNQVHIINGSLKTKDYQFQTSGYITFSTPINIDLKIKGNSSNIDKVIGIFNTNNTNSLSSDGHLGVSAIIKGNLGSKATPQVVANFKLTNGSISNKKGVAILDTLEFEGAYSNGKYHNLSSTSIKINNGLFVVGNSSVIANIAINNFKKPTINISGTTFLTLSDLERFNSNTTPIYSGQIDGEFSCNGVIDTKEQSLLKQFANFDKLGKFNIVDGEFVLGEKDLTISSVNGNLNINNKNVSINNFRGTIQNSIVEGDVSVNSYMSALIDTTLPFKINANIKADVINYKDYKHFFGGGKSNREIVLNGDIKADRVFFNKLVADNVSTHLYYGNNKLLVADLKLNTMEGSVLCDINYIKKDKNKYVFQTYTSTTNINITTLFSTFDNFGQTAIVSDNIGGLLTTDFDLEMDFINGKLKTSSIDFLGHSRIGNGKLIDFKPIKQASKFSKNDDMRNVMFTTLETNILISGGVINIPKIIIESNAFDMILNGFHKFNGDYKYHMRINLLDFIGNKSKRIASQQTEFGYIKDDGLGKTTLYLLATSKNGKSKIKIDGNEVKKSIKANAKDEKKELKKALHDQFGWFKKDTTLNDTKESEKPGFIIEWDEE